jgi:hypothetical protein
MTETAPWTIKSVPIAIRQAAVRAAQAQDQTVAQWVSEAVSRLANQQAGNLVIPPDEPDPAPIPAPGVDLTGLAAALNAAVSATLAAGGTPSKALGRDATATLRRVMRAARGLPDRQTRPRNRQTTKLIEINNG